MIKWDRKRVVRHLYDAAGPQVAMKFGLQLGQTRARLRKWFSHWRWRAK
jgi:hypothetical protein